MLNSYLPTEGLVIPRKFPLYVIEGIDGSGKSSVGPLVANKIGAAFHEYPKAFKPGIQSVDDLASPEARFMFYMGYNLQTYHDVSQILNLKPVICVRYLYSTIVYHIVKGVDKKFIYDIVKRVPLLRPQQVFFLDVRDKNIQMNRMSERGILSEDLRVIEKTEAIRATYLEHLKFMPNATYIDTSNMTMSQVVEDIISKIQ